MEQNEINPDQQYKKANQRMAVSAVAYLVLLLTFPKVYNYVVNQVMQAYDFRWAAIAAVWLILVGISMSTTNYFVVGCSWKFKTILRGAVFLIILGYMLYTWFVHQGFSMTTFLCAAINMMDLILCIRKRRPKSS